MIDGVDTSACGYTKLAISQKHAHTHTLAMRDKLRKVVVSKLTSNHIHLNFRRRQICQKDEKKLKV